MSGEHVTRHHIQLDQGPRNRYAESRDISLERHVRVIPHVCFGEVHTPEDNGGRGCREVFVCQKRGDRFTVLHFRHHVCHFLLPHAVDGFHSVTSTTFVHGRLLSFTFRLWCDKLGSQVCRSVLEHVAVGFTV